MHCGGHLGCSCGPTFLAAAVGFPNHGVARIARDSHRAVVCCSQSPQQDYQNTLGGIQGRHHWQRPGKMNSERLAWLNWAALATTEPNLLWAGYFFLYGFLQRDLFRSRGNLFVLVFTAGSFPIPFPIPRDLFCVWVFTAGYFPIPRDLFSDPAGSFFCMGFYSGIFSDPVLNI